MNEAIKGKTHIVYRYIDVTDGIIKYVGIANKDGLKKRIYTHENKDDWKNKGAWKIEYFECNNRSEAEAFESHLIALYETDRFYNKQKSGWGINKYLPDVEDNWKLWEDSHFVNVETKKAALFVRYLIRQGYIKEARALIDCFEYEELIEDGENW